MDKVIYLIDKDYYQQNVADSLTQDVLEEWVAECEYEGDNSIIKIDANAYDTIHQALGEEMGYEEVLNIEDGYWIRAFGF